MSKSRPKILLSTVSALILACLAGSARAGTLVEATPNPHAKKQPTPAQSASSQTPLYKKGQELLMGDDVKQSVDKTVSQLNWSNSLDRCKWEAQHDGKLIFWMHMLGTINGYT